VQNLKKEKKGQLRRRGEKEGLCAFPWVGNERGKLRKCKVGRGGLEKKKKGEKERRKKGEPQEKRKRMVVKVHKEKTGQDKGETKHYCVHFEEGKGGKVNQTAIKREHVSNGQENEWGKKMWSNKRC